MPAGLLGIEELDRAAIDALLARAKDFQPLQSQSLKKLDTLRGKMIVNLFFEASTRTRTSFEIAAKRLGADAISITAAGSSVSKGESLVDTLNTLAAMRPDAIVMRHAASGAPHFLARHLPTPIINAGDGTHEHPTQALLDARTILDRLGRLEGLRVAIIGDIAHSRVARSNVYLLSRFGAEIVLCGPASLLPPELAQLAPHLSSPRAEIFDATGLVVAPGFLDMHVHLRQPGFEHAETIESGSRAAAAGGFTSICCMPNTKPVNDSATVTSYIVEHGRRHAVVNVHPIGAITKGSAGTELAAIGAMKAAGAVAISDDGLPVMNARVMRRAMEFARSYGLPVIEHCEDLNLSAGGDMHEGVRSVRWGLRGIPSAAEDVMVARDLLLAELTGAQYHVAHISTRRAVAMVAAARQRGLPVTAEATPHHFSLADDDMEPYDSNYKMKPPLRSSGDREAVIEGIVSGAITAIATDHAPHPGSEKMQEFERCPFGIIGLETAIALSLEALVHPGRISLARMVELFTTGPESVVHLGRGTLEPGATADVAIFSTDLEWTYDVNQSFSRSRNSPFHNRTFRGGPVATIVNGEFVWKR